VVLPSRLPPKPSSISRCQCAVTLDSCVADLSLLGIPYCFSSNESGWMYVMRTFNELGTETSRFIGEDLNLQHARYFSVKVCYTF